VSARTTELELELATQRGYVQAVVDERTRLQSELAALKLTPEQLSERAVASLAEKKGIPAMELHEAIDLFAATVNADPGTDSMDCGLADFAVRNFASAAANFDLAADAEEKRLLAADQLTARAQTEASAARGQARTARTLQGQSLHAQQRYTDAVAAFERALALTPRRDEPEVWAELQVRLGNAASAWASASTGAGIDDPRGEGVHGHAETTGGAGDGRAFGKHELDGGLAELTVVLARFGNALCHVSPSLRQAGAYRAPVSTGGGRVHREVAQHRVAG